MRKVLSCEFNIDTACVELRLDDGTLLSIDCTAVENEVANSMYQRSELDWLIYNDPLAYAELILNGDSELLKKAGLLFWMSQRFTFIQNGNLYLRN